MIYLDIPLVIVLTLLESKFGEIYIHFDIGGSSWTVCHNIP